MISERFGKVIATLWPVIYNKWVLKKIDKFVDVYRINLSHADLFKTREVIKVIRDINSKKVFMLDTKWPEIRTTNIEKKQVKKWEVIKVFSKPVNNEISFEYKFFKNIPENIEIIFDDNIVVWKVLSNNSDYLEIKILQWWVIWFNKTINFKWYEIELDFLTEKDKEDIKFWVEENISLIAVSFIKTSEDIKRLKKYIKKTYDYEMKIIAKIETVSAVNDIDNIIKEADAIMIARWDLWANIDIVDLPRIQSDIIKKCNLAWKPVILATQVMSSMTTNPVPTRAEVDEIAYNIQNGVDVFMLSNETAVGNYPVETLETLNKTIIKYQENVSVKFSWEEIENYVSKDYEITDYILYNAKKMAYKLWVKFIITPTSTWFTPARLSSLKSTIPILAFTSSDLAYKYCSLMFTTYSYKLSPENMEYSNFKRIVWETLQKEFRGKINSEDKILIVHSSIAANIPWMINGIEVIKFKDL